MARRKVKLSWIANDSARKATLKKRRKGMLKKTKELSVLCDVNACAIVYSPDEYRPEVWPPEPERAMRVLSSFKSLPEMEKSKKMLNQEGFLRQCISKTQEQLQKLEKENRESRTKLLMLQGLDGNNGSRIMHALTVEDVTSLASLLEKKAKLVEDRLNHLTMMNHADAEANAAAAALVAVNNNNNHHHNNIHPNYHQQQQLQAPPPPAAAAAAAAVMGHQEMVQTPADWYMNVNPMMMMMEMNNNYPNPFSNDINPPPAPHHHQVAQENVANVAAAPMQHNQYAGHDEDQFVDPFLDPFFSP
ncbi:MADS box transcription factor domain-containing protein [Dioscorea alata]|uniref:MADS box transcription factor domain-containing protein n=1 Tax=Dioscorea alata TaxID=55571 RepID=A0ACB7VDA5_DIOAL|nr:MADS box transcription factor domain-containing protein [Dioscorea alata]